nr:MAG TPA: hypothetical protein [Caudoviricetes sp.]
MYIYFWLCVGFLHNISQHVIITYLILYINNVLSIKYLCFSVKQLQKNLLIIS